MSFNLNQIDELRKRANVSYEDARNALEKCNGDMVEALIYLEKQNKVKSNNNCSNFFDKVGEWIKKSNNTRFILKKKEDIVLNLSLTIVILITIFAPYITVVGLLIALFTGHRIKFEGKCIEHTKVNDTMDKISSVVDKAKEKMTQGNVSETQE
jgi:lipopolysaccharide/colanic/teichoic acid biosynthesis glycosyltransferase